MPENKKSSTTSLPSSHHHLKNLKQQDRNRNLINLVIDLINNNDHVALAYIARNDGIPPQLRHLVWPILLKYHPMSISPNIDPNTVTWDSMTNKYHVIENSNNISINSHTSRKVASLSSSSPSPSSPEVKEKTKDPNTKDLESIILHDLKKYFHYKKTNSHNKINHSTSNVSNDTMTSPSHNNNNNENSNDTKLIPNINDENEVIDLLKTAILNFLSKWSRIFNYELGLTWIALGLAEWCSPCNSDNDDSNNNNDDELGPLLLTGKRYYHQKNKLLMISNHHNNHNKESKDERSLSLNYLYQEYPLPNHIRKRLKLNDKNSHLFNFDQLFERLCLIILNCPDTNLANTNINNDFPPIDKISNLTNYFPILSGGDLSFQTQIFFKVFSSILPELYQPLTEESSLQPTTIKNKWLYWWLKFSGAKALQRQDRGRLWDILLGWRPKPTVESINFFLNYNTKKFDQLYSTTQYQLIEPFLKKNDPFWFPDLDSVAMGSKQFPYDYNIFKEILFRNRYDGTNSKNSSTNTMNTNTNTSTTTTTTTIAANIPMIPYSLIDPHIELIFIYIAILQYNEFKLLEFEETEISEFLSNIPMLSKTDDFNFRKLYDPDSLNIPTPSTIINRSTTTTTTTTATLPPNDNLFSQPLKPTSINANDNTNSSNNNIATSTTSSASASSSHMMIELGNDGKSSHSFNNILNNAGDIWRKWLYRELEETSTND
ncbi:Oca5p NDAI_0H00290 [Naumovozyma dairenensis CBS 421]|uniref:Rab-GAP TBC domain-containing protein n=1 Tax=Naumovozyma dairenensis (strain ATCC 10597 / BCRC 20456 / CBS 421 / NBRC 0211 / NRRL Y-12639) TaxID=1071378 RepID=G0WEJ2_NAUDC|nr:hypothetical protein NDAI_0H00290 [Naumovozyma dairenensis CBS 421]CCD26203.1 hypothetical protein NDAI_0H00290 [Naumovozyma dairenensis CBS 421]